MSQGGEGVGQPNDGNHKTERFLRSRRYAKKIGLSLRRGTEWIFSPFNELDGITLFTAVLAIVSIFQWRALVSTDEAAHMAARAALIQANALRGNMRRDQIAISPVGEGGKLTVYQGEKVIGWNITPRWTNTGATDARNVIAGYNINVLPISDACPKFPEHPDIKVEPVVVGPSGPYTQLSSGLWVEDVRKVKAQTHQVFIFGRMEYNDVFPDTPTHHFDWCVHVVPYFIEGQDIERTTFSFVKVRESAD